MSTKSSVSRRRHFGCARNILAVVASTFVPGFLQTRPRPSSGMEKTLWVSVSWGWPERIWRVRERAVHQRPVLQSRNERQVWYAQMMSIAGAATVVAFLVDSAGRPALFDMFTCLSVALVVGPALALGRQTNAHPEFPAAIERFFVPM
jgi:hypothetical protein